MTRVIVDCESLCRDSVNRSFEGSCTRYGVYWDPLTIPIVQNTGILKRTGFVHSELYASWCFGNSYCS